MDKSRHRQMPGDEAAAVLLAFPFFLHIWELLN